jgi:PAT family beta-lactamase induction signal transducer AmpG
MTLRRKLGWVAVLYFAEGLPFGLIKEVMPVYFRVHGAALTEIGLLSLLGLPWTLKVLWSPLVDRYGERRSWVTGCLLALALGCMALLPFHPVTGALGLTIVLLAIAIASATQDIAIDAYTIGLIDRGEEGQANGVRVSAYRVALIASGGGVVLLAPWVGWPTAFSLAALLFAALALLVRAAPRIAVAAEARRHWVAPMRAWLLRRGALAVFAFILLYKLGDATMGPMVKPFWLDRGLAIGEVGIVSGSFGVLATIAGALIGGRLTDRWGIWWALLLLGLAQAVSNLGYATVAWLDPPAPSTAVATWSDAWRAAAEPARGMIYGASLLESFCSGLGSAAFMAFLMHICDKEHAAVQYAALSAVFALSRDLAGAVSGWATEHLGYATYFGLTFGLAFPALALLPAISGWLREARPQPFGAAESADVGT